MEILNILITMAELAHHSQALRNYCDVFLEWELDSPWTQICIPNWSFHFIIHQTFWIYHEACAAPTAVIAEI